MDKMEIRERFGHGWVCPICEDSSVGLLREHVTQLHPDVEWLHWFAYANEVQNIADEAHMRQVPFQDLPQRLKVKALTLVSDGRGDELHPRGPVIEVAEGVISDGEDDPQQQQEEAAPQVVVITDSDDEDVAVLGPTT